MYVLCFVGVDKQWKEFIVLLSTESLNDTYFERRIRCTSVFVTVGKGFSESSPLKEI